MEVTEQTLIESLTVLHELAKNTDDANAEAFFDKEVTNRNWQGDATQGKLIVSMAVIKLSVMAMKGIVVGVDEIQEAINVFTAIAQAKSGEEEAAFKSSRNREVDAGVMRDFMQALIEIAEIVQRERVL